MNSYFVGRFALDWARASKKEMPALIYHWKIKRFYLLGFLVCFFFTAAAAYKSFLLSVEQVLTFANRFV